MIIAHFTSSMAFFPQAPAKRSVEILSPSKLAGRTVTFSIELRGKSVSSAELRLFKIKNPDSNSTDPERVTIYHRYVPQSHNPYNDIRMYAGSKLVSAENGYEVFNVTKALQNLIDFVNVENGRNSITGHNIIDVSTFSLEVSIGALGKNYTPSISFEIDTSANSTLTQLVIACYETGASSRRRKRDLTPAINSTECLMNPPRTCCLRNLVVDFHRDLGFNWILQPTTYAINYCAGLCPWTVPQASQSSMFLAYANERNPTASPQPCCAPDIFRPLTVVVQRYNSKNPSAPPTQEVQLIPDLVVQQCICR